MSGAPGTETLRFGLADDFGFEESADAGLPAALPLLASAVIVAA
jgi:hypothetical protein